MNKKPKLYYGYVVVAASVIIMMTGWGTYFSYGIFFESLLTEFNWSRAVTSGAFSASTLVSGFLGIITGRLSDRLGPRVISLVCCASLALGFVLMSVVHSSWQVYLIYAIPLSIGVSGIWSPLVSTVARWFVEKRGLMIGLVTAGIGVGGVIFSPLISHFITAYGWRNAYLIIGIIAFVLIGVSGQFLRRDPEQIGLKVHGVTKLAQKPRVPRDEDFTFGQAVRTRQFWMIAAVYILFGYSQVTVTVHIVPYAGGLGIPAIAAASILSIIGATSIFGRIILGGISDRIRVKPSFIFILILLLLSLVWLDFAGKLWALYLFAAVFGFAWGGLSSLQSIASVELFGLSSLGMLVGCFSFGFCIGGTIGPIISGYLFDVYGSYKLAFLICTVAALGTLLSILWLTPPKKRAVIPKS